MGRARRGACGEAAQARWPADSAGGAGNLDELGLFAGGREPFVLEELLELVNFELVELSCRHHCRALFCFSCLDPLKLLLDELVV